MKYVSSVQTVAFWSVVTKEHAASIFWDKAEDGGGAFHL